MNLNNLLLGLLFTLVASANECEDRIEFHLASKTPYRFVANKLYSKDDNLQGCVKKIWMMIRHGTRNPSVSQIKQINGYLPILRDVILTKNSNINESRLLKSEVELFKNWQPILHPKDEKKLTIEGENEMLELAERMQARFPDILPPVYSKTWYTFKFTKTQRTRKSARSFAIGLFDRKTAEDVYYPEPVKHDPILRFYKLCSKWKSSVKKNNATYSEKRKFENNDVMKMALAKISQKLGLDKVLSFKDAHLMYTTCAFETAWFINRKSPWCTPFDLDTIKIMEYSEDLKFYWVDGYGSDISYKQACTAFNDMLSFLMNENAYPKASFYFSHSGTILKLLAHLGLYNDNVPLTEDLLKDNNRKWRVSKIDTFGSNLALILHSCNDSNKLLVLHNENPVELPACPGNYLCDIDRLREYYFRSIHECVFDSICENTV